MLELLAKEFGVSLEEIIYGTKQQRNQKKLMKRAVIWGIVFVALLLVCIYAEPRINHYVSTHYVVMPSIIYACVVRPILYIFAGIFACSVIAVFYPIHAKKKESRRLLLVVGLIVIFVATIFGVIFFCASTIILSLVSNVFMGIFMEWNVFFILPGILFWFGIAKEPKND